MNDAKKACEEKIEKAKQDFLKKKNPEKFEFIYDEIQDLEEEIENKECDYSCNCDENTDWIEKIKIEQESNFERIDYLETKVYELEERLEKIEEMLGIEEMERLKNRLEKLEAEERTRKYFERQK